MHIVRSDWHPAPARLPAGQMCVAVGDIHGLSRHLEALQDALEHDVTTHLASRGATADRVYLGDYLDHGPDGGAVLDRVREALSRPDGRAYALVGNHDAVLLDLLHARLCDGDIADWRADGGEATLDAFTVPASDRSDPDALAAALNARLGGARRRFVETLRSSHQTGPYLFVHAGVHPIHDLHLQSDETLRTIRAPFLEIPTGLWGHGDTVVVHGHTPGAAQIREHRIGVDTGAPETGVLSAIELIDTRVRYVSAVSDDADASALPPR